ncbi:CYC3 [Candida oxycetoniae]|uniref:Holocytochrome c-type synthase n=1 Tax=Candida oxycetoniae TaxID=497107 RepID=A0AAI9WYJ3_9ASCO|nr:CYC3 [Candida oxycetoniae]KAI3404895.1 CYC3 [Candida oxycetoniae]
MHLVEVSTLEGCPVDHSFLKATCPVTSSNNELNPLNNMPMGISSEHAPGQKIRLPTERTISSIPRGESQDQGLWEYPSPQQMLNAMLAKGKGDGIPEDAVESMVEVHNFLNEGAWQQILEWEDKYTKETKIEPRLKKFTGKPHDLSPKARMYLWLGSVFPNTFNTTPPFDRHDWTVLRSCGKNQGWKEVRYIIDYYGAPDDEETGMPSFVLDTRPALDSAESLRDRIVTFAKPVWHKAMGDDVVERI